MNEGDVQSKPSIENLKRLVKRTSRLEWQSIGELYRPEYGLEGEDHKNSKLWALMSQYKGIDKNSIQTSIVNHVEYTLAKNRLNFIKFFFFFI